jgi:acetate kinase
MGIELDLERNRIREAGNREISKKDSRTKIFVIPTNEELVIARDTYLLTKSN